MFKKYISILLAVTIIFGFMSPVYANEDAISQKVNWMVDNGIVSGRTTSMDGKTDLALDENITRAEVTKLIVYILKLENLADSINGAIRAFSDVDNEHWANGYISVATTKRSDVAYGRRIVEGYPDGRFRPEADINYNELAAILVRIVKRDLTTEMEKNAIWATSYMRWAEEEGVLKDLTIIDYNKKVNRKNAFAMIYNAMIKLDRTNVNSPKFGDIMGIVSKFQSGKLQLNQDDKMIYNITYDTLLTDGTSYSSLEMNQILPGSLVRIIADENNDLTHIIELGNPISLAIPGRWFDVADNIVSAENNTFFKYNAPDSDVITVNGITAKIDKDTRIFVSDVMNYALKEVRTADELFEEYIRDRDAIPMVYMGYNTFSGRHEAKVLVFSKVDKFLGKQDLRRVTGFVGSNYSFSAESTTGKDKLFNVKKAANFPMNYNIELMDVVMLSLDTDNESLIAPATILIDHSEANVYLVKEISARDKTITLRDKNGYENVYLQIMETRIFLEDELEEGDHVQIHAGDYNALIAISKVDLPLKGTMEKGFRTGGEHGWVMDYAMSGKGMLTVTIGEKVGEKFVNVRSYEVASTDMDVVMYMKGREIVYDIGEKFGQTKYIYHVEPYIDYKNIPLPDFVGYVMTYELKSPEEIMTAKYLFDTTLGMGDVQNEIVFLMYGEVIQGAVMKYNAMVQALGVGVPIVLP